jgi:hypothetical protein
MRSLALAGAMAAAFAAPPSFAQDISGAVIAAPAPPTSIPGGIVVEQDTLIRLMVVNEVSTRTAKPGDRFLLRVDEAVAVDGVTVIPVGAKAWGEVLQTEKSGSVGKGGKLNARLLHVEVGGQAVPISGETRTDGKKGTLQVGMAMVALGPLALLAPGNNAKLKAGDIFNAYLAADMVFDPATGGLSPLSASVDAAAKP